MKLLVLACAVLMAAAVGAMAQGVNTEAYVTNSVVAVSSTTPTLLDAGRGARSSLSVVFDKTSAVNGMRLLVLRPDMALATQTNLFKAGTINGRYIHAAGTVNGVTIPVCWTWDLAGVPNTAVYGIADGTGVVANVNAATPTPIR